MNFISMARSAGRLPMDAERRRFRLFRQSSIAILLFCLAVANADASILVAPTRITLEPGERVGQVTVMNNGGQPVTLRISFVNYHMRADGSFVKADKPVPGEHFADAFLQYAPRRIHLEPGEGQVVRVLARPPAGAPAEYRTHMQFQTEPSTLPRQDTDQSGGDKGEFSVKLIPLYGVSIPVIVRTGELTATTRIDGLSVRGSGSEPVATFRLHRKGNRSIYGDIRLYLTPRGGEERLVGEMLGLAVYPPLDQRQVEVPFNKLERAFLPSGRLRVEYVDHDDNSRVLAEAERVIP